MSEGIAYLLNLPRFADRGADAYKPGLDRIRDLLEVMDNPQEAYPICHVAGTNGKGSTASMIAAILNVAGYRTGLHTSPHLLDITERMRVDGRSAPRSWVEDAVQRHRADIERIGPSFFEVTVALSLLYFAEKNVDAAVVEVGLGGRLDATNIVTPRVSVITSISLDHTELLGESIEEIASEKAGIIKSGVPIVSYNSQAAARNVIRRVAEERGSVYITPEKVEVEPASTAAYPTFTLRTPNASYDRIKLDIPGDHQIMNAALAILASEQMAANLTPDIVRSALGNVRELSGLRGRLEELATDPPIIVDVAHNADGIRRAIEYTRSRFRGGRLGIVFALMMDKSLQSVASVLKDRDVRLCLVPVEGDRAYSPARLARELQEHGIPSTEHSNVAAAVRSLGDSSAILIVGSHLLAALALRELGVD